MKTLLRAYRAKPPAHSSMPYKGQKTAVKGLSQVWTKPEIIRMLCRQDSAVTLRTVWMPQSIKHGHDKAPIGLIQFVESSSEGMLADASCCKVLIAAHSDAGRNGAALLQHTICA